MKLITKQNCQKCDFVKEKVGIKINGVEIIDGESTEGKVQMAYYEIFLLMDKDKSINFPFLITDKDEVIHGAINIKNHILNGGS